MDTGDKIRELKQSIKKLTRRDNGGTIWMGGFL